MRAFGSLRQRETFAGGPPLVVLRRWSSAMVGIVDYRGRPISRSSFVRFTSAVFIIGVEIAERMAYYGISFNLISYLSGPLSFSTADAAAAVNTWSGASMVLPILGAFTADSYLGRYPAIVLASLLYVLVCSPSHPCFQIAAQMIFAFAEGGQNPASRHSGPVNSTKRTVKSESLGVQSSIGGTQGIPNPRPQPTLS